MKTVEVDGVKIGNGYPCYFMAEIGGAYTDFDEAKRLIDSAKKIGICAIKFQTYEADTITTKDNTFDMENIGNVSQYELFKKYEPDKQVQRQIVSYSKKLGLAPITSPSHIKDLEFVKSLDISAYKIGSDLACHIPLLKNVARTQKPIILSTGMCTLKEVKESIKAIRNEGNNKIVLLHCISAYPTKHKEANLNIIKTFHKRFDLPVGFSDHTIGPEASLAAVALGANVIERHFIHDENKKGPDYILSSDEKEFKFIIVGTRKIEEALGNGAKKLSSMEKNNRKTNRVSVISTIDIPKGTRIEESMVDVRRPGTGIPPKFYDEILGKEAIKNIKKDKPLKWEMLSS